MPPRSPRSGRWSAAGPPHAILLSGPGGVGKTTLAMDLAAGLLCVHPDVAARPCRACRGCRLVDHGDHPDLHRLAPEGPGGQIVIGGRDATVRGVRDLIGELVLLPLEGGARVAIVEIGAPHERGRPGAPCSRRSRSRRPASPSSCAPTTRPGCCRRSGRAARASGSGPSACATSRRSSPSTASPTRRSPPGWPGSPPAAPGSRIAYARAPDAVRARGELARTLLDLLDARPARRLVAMREALPIAIAHVDGARGGRDADPPRRRTPPDRPPATRGSAGREGTPPPTRPTAPADRGRARGRRRPTTSRPSPPSGRAIPPPCAGRRRRSLVSVWTDVARDLALAGAGGARSVRDPDLLEELSAAAAELPDGAARPRSATHGAGGDAARRERVARAGARRPGPRLAAASPGRVTTEPARVEVVVRGSVQGVGYRYFAWREAMALDLEGWVANEPDGSVRCVAQGPRDRLEAFIAILRAGPPAALVERRQRALGPAGRRSRPLRRAQRVPPGRLTPSDHRRAPTGRVGYSLSRRPDAQRDGRWSRTLPPKSCLPSIAPSSIESRNSSGTVPERRRGVCAPPRHGSTRVPGIRARDAVSRTCSGGPPARRPARPGPRTRGRAGRCPPGVRPPPDPRQAVGLAHVRPDDRHPAGAAPSTPTRSSRRSARTSRTSGPTSPTSRPPGGTAWRRSSRERGDEAATPAMDAAVARAVDEIGRIRDPHRAIDWLSTYPAGRAARDRRRP